MRQEEKPFGRALAGSMAAGSGVSDADRLSPLPSGPTPRRRAVVALLLLLPIPSLATAAAMMWWPDTTLGVALFAIGKLYVLGFPPLWWLLAESEKLPLSRPTWNGTAVGLASGMAIAAAIAGAFLLAGPYLIDPADFRSHALRVGLGHPLVYLAGLAYWVCVNSLLEEMVWRWFVTTQFSRIVPQRWAVLCAAAAFTLHHLVSLSLYFRPSVVLIAGGGVFIGGAAWSWCYERYRSIWPGYISHVCADIAIFAIGWHMLFGGG